MTTPHFIPRALFIALALTACGRGFAADARELTDYRAQLLAAYKNGQTETDNNVKQLREKIAALEYIANAEARDPAPIAPPKLVDLDFPGGPMSSFLAALSKAGAPFNVVAEKNDLALELPGFSLRNADPGSLAGALGELLRQRGYALQNNVRAWPGQTPVYALRKLAAREMGLYDGSQFQSFQLGSYLEQQSVDDIIGAMRAAWELDPAHSAAALRLKFHPATSILLVSGPPESIGVITAVLGQLRKSSDQNIKPSAKSPPSSAEKR